MTGGDDLDRNAYPGSLDYLYSLEKFGMIFGLSKVEAILDAVEAPHRELQAVHIAGTNGKGSTAAMVASILQEEGYRVGLYTSPHLVRFTERIQVNGREIASEEVAALTAFLRGTIHAKGIAPPFTFFDFTTAMAFLYFRQQRVDLAVLEVGLGGRLDSTNVIDPLVSVITNISKDHEEQLGKTLVKITREKAGIIKRGRPLVTAATQPSVLRLLSKTCRDQGSSLIRVGKELRYAASGNGTFHYEGVHQKLPGVQVNLAGSHQIINATTALGAVEVLEGLGYRITAESMLKGLRRVTWPGRLERIASIPRVVLDGAHNPAGALALKSSLEETRPRRLFLLIGMMKDKDAASLLKVLAPLAYHVILTRPAIERAAPPSMLKEALGQNGGRAEVVEDLKAAIARGLALTSEEDLLCITGSLYTVGEARAYFYPEETS
jgi:dihydrofolate synthase / folylpolyglutamate synthase